MSLLMTPLCSAKSKPESVSRAFLNEFELAYHRAVVEATRRVIPGIGRLLITLMRLK